MLLLAAGGHLIQDIGRLFSAYTANHDARAGLIRMKSWSYERVHRLDRITERSRPTPRRESEAAKGHPERGDRARPHAPSDPNGPSRFWPLLEGKELSKGCRAIWSALLLASRPFDVWSGAYAQAEAVGQALESRFRRLLFVNAPGPTTLPADGGSAPLVRVGHRQARKAPTPLRSRLFNERVVRFESVIRRARPPRTASA